MYVCDKYPQHSMHAYLSFFALDPTRHHHRSVVFQGSLSLSGVSCQTLFIGKMINKRRPVLLFAWLATNKVQTMRDGTGAGTDTDTDTDTAWEIYAPEKVKRFMASMGVDWWWRPGNVLLLIASWRRRISPFVY